MNVNGAPLLTYAPDEKLSSLSHTTLPTLLPPSLYALRDIFFGLKYTLTVAAFASIVIFRRSVLTVLPDSVP